MQIQLYRSVRCYDLSHYKKYPELLRISCFQVPNVTVEFLCVYLLVFYTIFCILEYVPGIAGVFHRGYC